VGKPPGYDRGSMREAAAAFVRDVVRPAVAGWDEAGSYPREAVAASGLTGLFCPPEHGGAALGYPAGMEVFEELGRGDAALAFSLSMHNAVAAVVSGCDDEALRERWAADLAAGRALGGFSLTEPHAGSDATAITTRARQDGGGWRVTGRKAWVSLAGEADLFLVVCKTTDAPGHSDIAVVAVDRRADGVSFPRRYRTATAAFLPIGEMALADAPATMLVPAGAGMRAALAAIDVARCDIAAIACGLHAEALDIALRYARERQAFGAPLLALDTMRFALADVLTDLEAGRLLYARAAERLGTPAGPTAVAHAKRFCPDAALRAAIACSEALGAYGWLDDTPLPRFISLAKMLQVVDGTAEIQRLVIGRELERMAAATDPTPP
jgi:alkylation response protein AidB-like acyl-CoA dehydrogenase